MFHDKYFGAKVGHVVKSFQPDGMFSSTVAIVGIQLTAEHFRGVEKVDLSLLDYL